MTETKRDVALRARLVEWAARHPELDRNAGGFKIGFQHCGTRQALKLAVETAPAAALPGIEAMFERSEEASLENDARRAARELR